jgi:Biotin-requiring enzyme
MAESISEGTLKTWQKKVGDVVAADEEVATIETDKVCTALPLPSLMSLFSTFVHRRQFFGFLFFRSFRRIGSRQAVADIGQFVYPRRSTCQSMRRRQARLPSYL